MKKIIALGLTAVLMGSIALVGAGCQESAKERFYKSASEAIKLNNELKEIQSKLAENEKLIEEYKKQNGEEQ